MKKCFRKYAIYTTGFLFLALLPPGALAGTTDGTDNGQSVITGGIPTPRFRATVQVSEGYNDNVYTTADSQKTSSGFTNAVANVFADLGNDRTVFTLGMGGGLTYYYDRPGDKADKLANVTLNIVYKATDQLTLSFNSYNTYQVQPQFDLMVEQNRVNGQYYYTSQAFSAAYQWTRRFSTVTGYQVTGIFYEEAAVKQTNDYVQQTFSEQLQYLVLPTTTAVAEYRFGLVNYMYDPALNVTTNYFLAGLNHSFSPKFTMSLRAGGEIQNQNSGGVSSSPYAEFTTSYQYQRYSNLQAYANYGFQYSNLALAQSDKALRLGITINQAITPKLIASLGFFYEHDDYSTTSTVPGYTEDTLNVNVGLNYAVTPRLSLQASYQHTSLLSNNAGLQYDQNIVSAGATYSF